MAEYIEREALIGDLTAAMDHRGMGQVIGQTLIRYVKRQPTADVVPVVRCKDCKWFADNNVGKWFGCQMFQVVLITPEDAPKPDDFCSYGERKEADHE